MKICNKLDPTGDSYTNRYMHKDRKKIDFIKLQGHKFLNIDFVCCYLLQKQIANDISNYPNFIRR